MGLGAGETQSPAPMFDGPIWPPCPRMLQREPCFQSGVTETDLTSRAASMSSGSLAVTAAAMGAPGKGEHDDTTKDQ